MSFAYACVFLAILCGNGEGARQQRANLAPIIPKVSGVPSDDEDQTSPFSGFA